MALRPAAAFFFQSSNAQWVAGFGGSLVVDPPGVRKSSKGTNQRCHRSWP
jgi:hypothetical protein